MLNDLRRQAKLIKHEFSKTIVVGSLKTEFFENVELMRVEFMECYQSMQPNFIEELRKVKTIRPAYEDIRIGFSLLLINSPHLNNHDGIVLRFASSIHKKCSFKLKEMRFRSGIVLSDDIDIIRHFFPHYGTMYEQEMFRKMNTMNSNMDWELVNMIAPDFLPPLKPLS